MKLFKGPFCHYNILLNNLEISVMFASCLFLLNSILYQSSLPNFKMLCDDFNSKITISWERNDANDWFKTFYTNAKSHLENSKKSILNFWPNWYISMCWVTNSIFYCHSMQHTTHQNIKLTLIIAVAILVVDNNLSTVMHPNCRCKGWWIDSCKSQFSLFPGDFYSFRVNFHSFTVNFTFLELNRIHSKHNISVMFISCLNCTSQ